MNKEQIKTFWKDYPNTDTPLDANNLNTLNEELLKIAEEDKYYQATATDNGDYKIDIDKTFSNGDVIKIMFPTATDNDKQARLSVDDGNTYYNVEGVKAEHIENNNLELLFKNNEWLFISDIISSGNNVNGNWTKYKDGTLKQWGKYEQYFVNSSSLGIISYANTEKELPKSFINNNYTVTASVGRTAGIYWVGVESNNFSQTNSFRFRILSGSSFDDITATISWEATGRWK